MDDIWQYILESSGDEEIALNLLEAIADRFLMLNEFPGAGRKRDDDLRPGMRSFPVRDYLIFYSAASENIHILRVLHGSRDLSRIFSANN